MYIDLADLGSSFFSNTKSDGSDIRVTTNDGTTEVPRELASFDAAASTGELYFKAPTLSSSTDSFFISTMGMLALRGLLLLIPMP